MMKLYWAPRTRSLRALWVLEEAGVPYQRVRLDLSAGEQKSADYRAINPMAKVPALTDRLPSQNLAPFALMSRKLIRSGPCPAGWGSRARPLPAMAVFFTRLC
jgi:hypothetical protein